MKKTTAKAFYLYLCSILGMILFAMLHRAVFVLYDLLLVMDYDTYAFGMTSRNIMTLDFTTMLIALFLGGWYGVALGIEWYAMVYGPNAEKPAGLFHGFVPHHWRKTKTNSQKISTSTENAVHVPVAESKSWSFDDLIKTAPATVTSVPKKRATARKTTTRKVTKRVKAPVTE